MRSSIARSLARQRGQATAHTRRRVLSALRGIDTVNQGLSVVCRTDRQKSVKTRNFLYTCGSGNFSNKKKSIRKSNLDVDQPSCKCKVGRTMRRHVKVTCDLLAWLACSVQIESIT
jgi:hypothetical protein